MSFGGLILDDADSPLGNQPVPLRLACFIGGWTVREYFALLSSQDRHLGFKVPVHQYLNGNNEPLEANQAVISRLYNQNEQHSETLFLQAIDKDYFIWSDDLQSQIDAYARNILGGDDNAQEYGFTHHCRPAAGTNQKLISECSDFHDLLTTEQKRKATARKRKKTKLTQYKSWCDEYKKLKAAYQKTTGKKNYSYQQAASSIFANKRLNPNKKVGKTHIAKMLGRYCK